MIDRGTENSVMFGSTAVADRVLVSAAKAVCLHARDKAEALKLLGMLGLEERTRELRGGPAVEVVG